MGKTFGIALVPVLGGAMPNDTPVTVRRADILWVTGCIFWSKQTVKGFR